MLRQGEIRKCSDSGHLIGVCAVTASGIVSVWQTESGRFLKTHLFGGASEILLWRPERTDSDDVAERVRNCDSTIEQIDRSQYREIFPDPENRKVYAYGIVFHKKSYYVRVKKEEITGQDFA